MKLTTRHRIWWVLMHDDPRGWLGPLQWIIPAAVGLWTVFAVVVWKLGL